MTSRNRFEAAGNVITVDDLSWRRKRSRPGLGVRRRRPGQLGRSVAVVRLSHAEPPAS